MKISLILTFAILTVATVTGVWRHREITALRTEREKLREEVARRGVDPRRLEGEKGSLSPEKTREILADIDAAEKRLAREAETRAIAREMVSIVARRAKEARALANYGEQKKMMEILEQLNGLGEEDFRVLLDEIHRGETATKGIRGELTGTALMVMARQSPRTALDWILENKAEFKDYPGHAFTLGTCLRNFAQKDPNAALDWLDRNKNNDLITASVRMETLGGVAAKDPELALRRLMEWSERDDQGQNLLKLNHTFLAQADKDALLTAARKIAAETGEADTDLRERAERLKDSALSGIGSLLLSQGIERAREWLRSTELDETEKDRLFQSLEGRIQGNPSPWLELMREHLPEEQMAGKLRHVISFWTLRDFNAVGEWLNTQPPGILKETAVLSFAEALFPHEPEAARRWLDTVPDSDRKRRILSKMEKKAAAGPPASE